MTPRTGLKLYLLGGLSILSLVLAALAFFGVLAAQNRSSIGFQYLFVGVLLAILFLYFDGISWLKSGLGIEGTLTSTSRAPSSGRDFEQSTQNLEPPVDSLAVWQVPVDEPITGPDSQGSNRARSGMLVPFVAAGIEPSVRWNIANELIARVKQHEGELVDRLIDEELLTIEGPITDRDVRAMVWVAVSSIALADNLLNGVADQTWAEIPRPARALPRAELPE